jgi:tape measure domain-containing protein
MTDRTIRVVLDSSGVTRGARGARGALSGVQKQTGLVANGFRQAANAAKGLFAVLGARELIRTANTFQQLQNSLRVVTDSTEELNAANTRLFEIATATRTPIEAIVTLFSRASIAAEELGASQEDLFKLTEITGQALAVQGGSAQEASGALRQLSQSFSSGVVRAEEFNSILEGAFPLAQAAARGFDEAGGSVGKLRNLVVEGKVSSEEFFRAILAGGEVLEEQFGQAIPTVSQALTNLNTSFIGFIGQLDDAGGFSMSLASTILEVGEGLAVLGNALTGNLGPLDETSSGFNTFAISLITVGSALGVVFDLLALGKDFFVAFGEGLGGVAAGVVQLAKGNFSEASAIFADTTAFDKATLGTTDFFESFAANIDGASLKISEVLIPSFRTAAEAAEDLSDVDTDKPLVNPNAAEDLADAADDITDFQAALTQATRELEIQIEAGDDAAEAILQYRSELELAAAAQEIFGELVPTEEVDELREAFVTFGEEALAAQVALREEIESAELSETFQDQIEALEEEILLLAASNEAIAVNAEVRALAAGATEAQAARIRELTEALLEEKDAAADALPTLQDFFDDVSDASETTLSGIIADPLAEGLDEIPFKFAQLLQQLAAEALAAEVFDILGNLGGGGGGGGFLGFLGGLFGGGFQAGGTVRGGQPILVGERGPEIFTPPGSGSIDPNININQAAQAPPMVNVINVTDPADIPSGIETPEGAQAIINVIQRNPEAVRRVLG